MNRKRSRDNLRKKILVTQMMIIYSNVNVDDNQEITSSYVVSN